MFFYNKDRQLSGPRRITESCFILLVILSVFIFIAIASHDGQDPSWSQTGFSQQTNNLVGKIGASISDVLLSFIGYGAYMIPLILLYLGFCILIKKFKLLELDWFTIGLRVLGFCFIFCSVEVLISMNVLNNGSFNSGGIVGTILSALSISYLNELGTSLLFLCLFLCGIPLFTGVSWLTVCDVIGDLFFNIVFYKSIRDRRLAEEQLASLMTNKEQVKASDEQDSKYTTIDPKTGFAVYLRDDDELRYAGSAYDDDDPPLLLKIGEGRAAQSAETKSPEPKVKETPAKPDTSRIVDLTEQRAKQSARSDERVEPELNLDFASAASSKPAPAPAERTENRTAAVSEPAVSPAPAAARPVQPVTVAAPVSPQREPAVSAPVRTPVQAAPRPAVQNTASAPVPPSTAPAVKPAAAPARPASDPVVVDFTARSAAAAPAPAASVQAAPAVSPDDDIDRFLDSIEPDAESVLDKYEDYRIPAFDDTDLAADDFDETPSSAASPERQQQNTGLSSAEPEVSDSDLSGVSSRPYTSEAEEQQLRNAPWAQEPQQDADSLSDAQETDFESAGTAACSSMVDDARPFYPKYDEVKLRDAYSPDVLPGTDLLRSVPQRTREIPREQLEQLGLLIEQKLKEFRIEAAVVGYERGPVVTRFSLQLSPGTKVSTINNISRDLARELAAKSLRVIDIIPGTTYVGLEIPNSERTTIFFKELIDSSEFQNSRDKLTCALGCDIVGKPVVMNLAKMPHLLVAGTTGSGKSVGVNGMILSMLYKATPDDLRLIMIDPKMLEFSSYNDIPHLLTEVVTDIKLAPNALRWCVGEMERRYKLMMKLGVKKIDEFNEKVVKAIDMGTPILDPLWDPTAQLSDERPYLKKLPYIVVVIDELADMMMQVGKLVEELIARLAQKARAAGIHMIIATQSPRSDVLTGLIKSNIPSRVAFTVANGMESRIILEQQGAECLLGNGDMLFNPTGSNNPIRVHGAYVSPDEIDRIVEFWKQQGEPEYVDTVLDDEITEENALPSEKAELEASRNASAGDDLLPAAVRLILDNNSASASLLQRRLGVGFPRAGKIVDQLEDLGLISKPLNSAGKRNVIKDRCEAFLESNGSDTGAINSFGYDGY